MRAAWAIGQTAYSVTAVVAAAWSMLAALSAPAVAAIPGAMSSPATILFVASLVAAPVSLIVSAAVGWLGYARRGVRLTLAAFGVVLLNGVLFALSLGAIQIFCGGEFACSA